MDMDTKTYDLPSSFSYIGAIIVSCLCLYAIVVDILAILTYCFTPSLKQAQQNIIIMALLVCSLTSSIHLIVIHFQTLLSNSWKHLADLCFFDGFILQNSTLIQIYILFVMAVDRYSTIIYNEPLSKAALMINLGIGILIASFINTLPFWISQLSYGPAPSKYYCIANFEAASNILFSSLVLLYGMIFTFAIFAIYIRIYLNFRNVTRNRTHEPIITNVVSVKSVDKETSKKEYKILVTSFTLAGWTLIGNVFEN
jgi:hypothetical protein